LLGGVHFIAATPTHAARRDPVDLVAVPFVPGHGRRWSALLTIFGATAAVFVLSRRFVVSLAALLVGCRFIPAVLCKIRVMLALAIPRPRPGTCGALAVVGSW